MRVVKEGKVVSELADAAHLNAMLRSEAFLEQFRPVDEVATQPFYFADFSLAKPGYNEQRPRTASALSGAGARNRRLDRDH